MASSLQPTCFRRVFMSRTKQNRLDLILFRSAAVPHGSVGFAVHEVLEVALLASALAVFLGHFLDEDMVGASRHILNTKIYKKVVKGGVGSFALHSSFLSPSGTLEMLVGIRTIVLVGRSLSLAVLVALSGSFRSNWRWLLVQL
jgi:hypothetical protein